MRKLAFATFTALFASALSAQSLPNPILFVTQMPIPGDFATIGSVFGNHRAETATVGRGGDLYIRYPDGFLRNLTAEAGFGVASGFQGANSIAVRDPVVHWSGTRAAFAMVVGAPTQQFQVTTQRWQLYEVTGLGRNQTAVITRVTGQPAAYNNVEPAYASDGDLIFVSDRPRDGAAHLYPALDEYESRAITSGLWRLDPASGALTLLEHAPSGSFTPRVDSFGRVIFTRWDHLQRDQQNDDPGANTFNYASEAPGAPATPDRSEIFPSPRVVPPGTPLNGHTFNQMFPWEIRQDGSGEEMLNHLGRQELLSFFRRSFTDDPNLVDFTPGARFNQNPISFALQMREDPTRAGRYLAIDAREFEEHASGQLIAFEAPLGRPADQIAVEYLTSRQTYCCHDPDHPDHTGHYRNPLPLSDGRLVVVHTPYRGTAVNLGTRAAPRSPFDFRLKRVARGATWYAPVENLTAGISKSVSYWDPDVLVSYSGEFWELSPVEVRAQTPPPETSAVVEAPEHAVFVQEVVDLAAFRQFLRERDLGVIVVRDATARDESDRQQPVNLRVPGGVMTTRPAPVGRIYDIAHLQVYQGDSIRAGGGSAGRRVLAQHLHDPAAVALNAANPGGPPGSVRLFADGSAALFVPARRALSWQTTAANGDSVVQERFWITLQAGEIRACDGCHGVNTRNQAGQPKRMNTALALRDLLARWRTQAGNLFATGFE